MGTMDAIEFINSKLKKYEKVMLSFLTSMNKPAIIKAIKFLILTIKIQIWM